MPLTNFQITVLQLLAKNRNPESYLAGGSAINRQDDSYRYSADLDLFHDATEGVALCSKADMETLQDNGYNVAVTLRQPGFVQAIASHSQESLKLDWAVDSTFRFFPVEKDPLCGYRLHDADLATNKALALANRSELRDVLDLLQIHQSYLTLPLVCWAACGKDQGFTPGLLLDCLRRNSRFTKENLEQEHLAKKLDLIELKQKWLRALDDTENELQNFPGDQLGCLYLDKTGKLVQKAKAKDMAGYIPHYGKVRGSWPNVSSL